MKKKNVNEEESKISIERNHVSHHVSRAIIHKRSKYDIYKYTYLCVTIYTYVKISCNNKYRFLTIDERRLSLSNNFHKYLQLLST